MTLLEFDLAKGLILSVLMGFAVGIQRELSYHYTNSTTKFTGARSFALISLLGFFTGYFRGSFEQFSILLGVIFGLLIVSSYIVRAIKNEKNGVTTEFAAIATFASGFLVYEQNYTFAVFAVVLILIILELRQYTLRFKDKITQKDLQSAILFLLITFVILPSIPNKTIDPYGVFNPYSIWLMVVIISGLSFAGYIASRVVGASNGLLTIGFLGGLVSSTATTITLSKKVNESNAKQLALSIAIACTTMFVRIVVLMFVVDSRVAYSLALFMLPAAFCGYLYIYFSYRKLAAYSIEDSISYENPLELQSALQLGILFGIIFGATKLLQDFAGSYGVYMFAFISGLTDIDAISLSLAQLFVGGKVTHFTVVVGVLTATISNTIAKLGISLWAGNKILARELGVIMLIPLAIASVIFAFLNASF